MVGMDHSTMDHSKMDHSGHMMGHSMDHSKMAGMASPEQMAKLATLEGTEFDRMFLTLMIAHHEGAIDMVDALLDGPVLGVQQVVVHVPGPLFVTCVQEVFAETG